MQTARNIGDIQDQLIAKMADASMPLPADVAIVPVTEMSSEQVVIDQADQLAVALKYSPELSRACAAIEINQINVPRGQEPGAAATGPDRRAQSSGLGQSYGDSYESLDHFGFLNYNLALAFQYPLGNRAAIANRHQAYFNLDKSVTAMQGTADQVALAVRSAIRQVNTAYEGIKVNEQALRASIESRDALDARLQALGQMTPNDLQTQLTAQQDVATNEQALLEARTEYNIALATLARATGSALEQEGVLIRNTSDFYRTLSERARLDAPSMNVPPPADEPSPSPGLPAMRRIPCLENSPKWP